MSDHSQKVYLHHLEFLKQFPELESWLSLNGFSCRFTVKDPGMQTIYTTWDNHTTNSFITHVNDATEIIQVVYCTICKTVEVFRRCILFSMKTEIKKLMNLIIYLIQNKNFRGKIMNYEIVSY